jgi:hypothetical protein
MFVQLDDHTTEVIFRFHDTVMAYYGDTIQVMAAQDIAERRREIEEEEEKRRQSIREFAQRTGIDLTAGPDEHSEDYIRFGDASGIDSHGFVSCINILASVLVLVMVICSSRGTTVPQWYAVYLHGLLAAAQAVIVSSASAKSIQYALGSDIFNKACFKGGVPMRNIISLATGVQGQLETDTRSGFVVWALIAITTAIYNAAFGAVLCNDTSETVLWKFKVAKSVWLPWLGLATFLVILLPSMHLLPGNTPNYTWILRPKTIMLLLANTKFPEDVLHGTCTGTITQRFGDLVVVIRETRKQHIELVLSPEDGAIIDLKRQYAGK